MLIVAMTATMLMMIIDSMITWNLLMIVVLANDQDYGNN